MHGIAWPSAERAYLISEVYTILESQLEAGPMARRARETQGGHLTPFLDSDTNLVNRE
jgi:hypothetical protein